MALVLPRLTTNPLIQCTTPLYYTASCLMAGRKGFVTHFPTFRIPLQDQPFIPPYL